MNDDFDLESPETRARLDYACRPWDMSRKTHRLSTEELELLFKDAEPEEIK